MSSTPSQAARRVAALTAQVAGNPVAHFAQIPEIPPDEIFNTGVRFRADPDPRKVNLGVGAYRTDDDKPLVLNVVRKAESLINADRSLNKEYLDIAGDAKFVALARGVLFGADSPAIKDGRLVSAQSISGTGALRVGCEFIAKHLPKDTTIFFSNPTWGNHKAIFQAAGVPAKTYRYWDAKNRKLDIGGMLEDLQAAPEASIILLHACAHNPTGVDPTREQWKQIAAVMKARKQIPFFDSAYQGFASGSLEDDAWAIRHFVEQGFEMFAAQSFAKNFGLYNDRIGTISIVTESKSQVAAVMSQLKMIIRANYSNPPAHGARIVKAVLSDPALFEEWKQELRGMSGRIIQMRSVLYDALVKLNTPGDWNHIKTQIGMFSFTGLTPKQCEVLSNKHHIYLLSNGRISMCGINTKNIDYLAKAINDVVVNVK